MSAERNVLFVVSEYGEFSNLIGLADDMVSHFAIHPVFAFKSDYGALDRHRQLLEQRGYSWVSEKHANLLFDMSEVDLSIDDYLPFGIAKGGRASSKRVATSETRRLRPVFLALRVILYIEKILLLLFFPVFVLLYILFFFLFRIPQKIFKLLNRQRVRGRVISLGELKGPVRWRLRWMEGVFRRFDPVLVVSGQDYPLSIVTIAASVAEKNGVKTVIVPFSMTPTTKEIAESFAELGINQIRNPFLRKLLQVLVPNWVHRYRGRYYSRLSLTEIVGSELYKLSPPQPWTPNSGRGIIMVPSRQSMDYCLAAGIPAQQLRLTGPLWSDELLSRQQTLPARREKLIRDIRLARNYWLANRAREWAGYDKIDTEAVVQDDKRLVVFSWPPNQWPRRATGFQTYEAFNLALVEMLAGIMHSRYANVAISLHPTLVGTEFADTIRGAGLYITDADLIDVIDCADIFSATVSSTLFWSLQLGIPSINLDAYRYGYREFKAAGMLEAGNIRQLRDQLMTLISSREAYDAVARTMDDARDYWTISDGSSRDRILTEIDGLMGTRTSRNRRRSED